jgi:hypothetical protein
MTEAVRQECAREARGNGEFRVAVKELALDEERGEERVRFVVQALVGAARDCAVDEDLLKAIDALDERPKCRGKVAGAAHMRSGDVAAIASKARTGVDEK